MFPAVNCDICSAKCRMPNPVWSNVNAPSTALMRLRTFAGLSSRGGDAVERLLEEVALPGFPPEIVRDRSGDVVSLPHELQGPLRGEVVVPGAHPEPGATCPMLGPVVGVGVVDRVAQVDGDAVDCPDEAVLVPFRDAVAAAFDDVRAASEPAGAALRLTYERHGVAACFPMVWPATVDWAIEAGQLAEAP